jgi:hypothetical protein
MTNTKSCVRFLLGAALLTGMVLVAACAMPAKETPGTPHGCSPATTPCQ